MGTLKPSNKLRILVSSVLVSEYLYFSFLLERAYISNGLLCVGVILLVVINELEKKDYCKVTIQKVMCAAHVIILISLSYVVISSDSLRYVFGFANVSILKMSLAGLLLSTVGFVFLSPVMFFRGVRKNPILCGLLLLAMGGPLVLSANTHAIWNGQYGAILSGVVWQIVNVLGYDTMITISADGGAWTLASLFMGVKIYTPCAGFQGMSFFMFLFPLVLMWDRSLYSIRRAIILYVAGIVMMALMNVLRIVVFFIVSHEISQAYGRTTGSDLIVSLFHSNVGWLFYGAGIAVFFVVLFHSNLRRQRALAKPVR